MPVDPAELTFEFYRASGPGGQNVNKVATAVRIRWDVGRSTSLTEPIRERLARLAGSRLTSEGVLVIESQRFRTQERNRQDALERLESLVRRAWQTPRRRRPTRPTIASRERRIEAKKRRGALKRGRTQAPRLD